MHCIFSTKSARRYSDYELEKFIAPGCHNDAYLNGEQIDKLGGSLRLLQKMGSRPCNYNRSTTINCRSFY